MNYNEIIRPFTAAVAKTTGSKLPEHPELLSEASRRFLAEMVMSEMIEYEVSATEVDDIDAIVDAMIYVTDTCLRYGFRPYIHEKPVFEHTELVDEVWSHVKYFVKANTIDSQRQALSFLLQRLARGHHFDLLPFVKEVAKANLQKINADGTVTLNEKGKVMKPIGFVSPDLSKILKEVKNG